MIRFLKSSKNTFFTFEYWCRKLSTIHSSNPLLIFKFKNIFRGGNKLTFINVAYSACADIFQESHRGIKFANYHESPNNLSSTSANQVLCSSSEAIIQKRYPVNEPLAEFMTTFFHKVIMSRKDQMDK